MELIIVGDKLTPVARSELMARVRAKNTKPERIVRSLLHRMGYRFRLHRRDLPGCPDIVLPGHRKIIFVHGCFWHQHLGCKRASKPKTRVGFWEEKFRKNVERDSRAINALKGLGWSIEVVWECETTSLDSLEAKLLNFLRPH